MINSLLTIFLIIASIIGINIYGGRLDHATTDLDALKAGFNLISYLILLVTVSSVHELKRK